MRDGVLGMAVQVVGGAVERVDNPFVFGFFGAAAAAFFGGDFMLGIGFLQDFADDFFGSAVYVGNEIVECLAVNFVRHPDCRLRGSSSARLYGRL